MPMSESVDFSLRVQGPIRRQGKEVCITSIKTIPGTMFQGRNHFDKEKKKRDPTQSLKAQPTRQGGGTYKGEGRNQVH